LIGERGALALALLGVVLEVLVDARVICRSWFRRRLVTCSVARDDRSVVARDRLVVCVVAGGAGGPAELARRVLEHLAVVELIDEDVPLSLVFGCVI